MSSDNNPATGESVGRGFHAPPFLPSSLTPRPVPWWVYGLAALAFVVGAVTFAAGAAARDPAPAWRALLVNFLFWASVGWGALLWSAIFRAARTRWSAPFNRLGHSTLWFAAFSLPVFILLFFGRGHWLTWINADMGDRTVWLNAPFLFLRDGLGLAAIILLGWAFVRTYLRVDRDRGLTPSDFQRAARRANALSVGVSLIFAALFTLLGFDLVMSLTPVWYSALFGAYFMLGGLYLGIATVIILAILLRGWLGIGGRLGPKRFQDVGNLLMAFGMAMTYFFYSQGLVIWYGNLPREVSFAIPRLHHQPWQTLSWIVLACCYGGPFLLLFVREVKENPRALLAVACLVFAAMWVERYLLVAPSYLPHGGPFPWPDLLIGLGFLGVFVLTVVPFLARLPAAGRLDLALGEEQEARP